MQSQAPRSDKASKEDDETKVSLIEWSWFQDLNTNAPKEVLARDRQHLFRHGWRPLEYCRLADSKSPEQTRSVNLKYQSTIRQEKYR